MQAKTGPVTVIKNQWATCTAALGAASVEPVRRAPGRAACPPAAARRAPRGALPGAAWMPPAPTPFKVFGTRRIGN